MSDIFFQELGIPHPDYNLGIGSGDHGGQTGRMLIEIEKVLLAEGPDIVLVYGDTNSTLAGSLAASKLHIPVAHVEAGLRSYNRNMPEEINRVLTDHVSSILFCPTENAVRNLEKEGFTNIVNNGALIDAPISHLPLALSHPLVVNAGDVMFDLSLLARKNVNHNAVLNKFKLEAKNYILVTIHRAENTDAKENLECILRALCEVAKHHIKVFFPVHPRTRNVLNSLSSSLDIISLHIELVDPVSYSQMVALESNARIILTDSGGVQKEGYFYETPCVVPRHETEWAELTDTGWVTLTGINEKTICESIFHLWNSSNMPIRRQFYGDGMAGARMCGIIYDIIGRP